MRIHLFCDSKTVTGFETARRLQGLPADFDLPPFTVVANITALVALDFLGFGLPAPTPSWGELIGQGMENLTKWWLVLYPLAALFITLLLIVFIGEAIREAFDPREFSRLR